MVSGERAVNQKRHRSILASQCKKGLILSISPETSVVNSAVRFFLNFWHKRALLCWQLGIQLLITIPVRTVTASLIPPYFRLLLLSGSCFLMPLHAAGLDPAYSWALLMVTRSQHLSSARVQGICFVAAAAPRAFFKLMVPIHKHSSSEGNGAEHYVTSV